MSATDEGAILYNGPKQRRDIIIGFPYKGLSNDERNEWVENFATRSMLKANLQKALAIVINVERDHYPYSMIACLEYKEDPQ